MPFAEKGASLLRMGTKRTTTRALLNAITKGEHRSPLFWWMVENHDEIAAAAGKRIHWKGVCSAAAERGLTDTRGQPPSLCNARRTWWQARLAVTEARKRLAAAPPPRPGAKYPSRISKDWRPTEVTPASAPMRAPVAGPPQPADVLARPLTPEELRMEPPEGLNEKGKAMWRKGMSQLIHADSRFRLGGRSE